LRGYDNPTNTLSDVYAIAATLVDDDGGTVTASTTVTVNNVAPVIDNVFVTSDIDENGIATLTGTIVDPGLADLLTVVIDWDDLNNATDSVFAVSALADVNVGDTFVSSSDGAVLTVTNVTTADASFSAEHQYLDDSPSATESDRSSISATVTDDDGGESTVGGESPAQRVLDIQLGGVGSNPDELIDVNGQLFFFADDGLHGSELWTSDGTESGTYLVKDINPGPAGSLPTFLIDSFLAVDNTLYFSADDGTNGVELWKSDGTAAGTTMVADINPGPASSYPLYLTSFDNRVFLVASKSGVGDELWVTDGTAAGTTLFKDIRPGGGGSAVGQLTEFDGELYFTGREDLTSGFALWKTDGTSGNVQQVLIPHAGSTNSPQRLRWRGITYSLVIEAATATNSGVAMERMMDHDWSLTSTRGPPIRIPSN
jgi:ELWxxDGT repeat protein